MDRQQIIDENNGWRLVITDAAAGSRFYVMEKTMDGGSTWECINDDPFSGQLGVAEGLIFYDENFGVAGITGASQSYSRLSTQVSDCRIRVVHHYIPSIIRIEVVLNHLYIIVSILIGFINAYQTGT